MERFTRPAPFLLLAALALAGCDPFTPLRQSESEILRANFIEPDVYPAPPPLFCYRTLGKPMCYRRPLAGEGERLIESYPPHESLPEEVIR